MKNKLMNYRERLDLDFEFNSDNAVCGYLRKYHRYKDKLIGTCSLIDKRCSRDLPNDMNNCPNYIYWLKKREV